MIAGQEQAAPRSGLVLLLCFLVAALEGYDIQAFGVIVPVMARDLSMSSLMIGIAGGAAMAGMVVGASLGGMVAARHGPKPALIGATVVFAVCSLAAALVQSASALAACRLAMGTGLGAAMPNLLAIAMRLRPGGRHAAISTMMFCGMPVGGAAVSLVAASLGNPLPWRTLVALGGLVPLALTPALIFALPRFSPAAVRDPDNLFSVLFGKGRAVRTVALWVAFIAALLLLYLLLNWLPLLVIASGSTAILATKAALTFNIGGIIGGLLFGKWADRQGYLYPIWAAVLLLLAGAAGLIGGGGAATILGSAALLGCATVAAQYLLYAASPVPYPGTHAIAAAGVAIGIGRLGSIAGPLLAGWARQSGVLVTGVFVGLLPVAILVGIATTIALRPGKGSDRPVSI